MAVYAHSLEGKDPEAWELLAEHLDKVGETAALLATRFGWSAAGRLLGRLHDIGKCSAEFQSYLRKQRPTGGDHSGAGAIEVLRAACPKPMPQMLAAVIAGHHAGLPDGIELEKRLQRPLPPYPNWQRQSGPLPDPASLGLPPSWRRSPEAGFSNAFVTRMLFSCLVDADSLETEAFYASAENRIVERGPFRDLRALRDLLDAHMAEKGASAEASALNALRAEVLQHAKAKAELPPGLFTLTVPTGGGKTLASLSFALHHAVRHGLRRIVYVIPFTSVIEQTAGVFRAAFGSGADVLEHHASFDWDEAARKLAKDRDRGRDDEGGDPATRLHRAAENWDVPIVVTTAVQFFESLYAAGRSRCRKLHNLAGAVIVLDEAQTLPVHLLRPCMAALDELALNYGSSVVLCTATQPALREVDGFVRGFKLDDTRELAPAPKELYERLKRVTVERLAEPVTDKVIAARFAERPQMLCIVNSRPHANRLFGAIKDLEGAVYLTTWMCPLHRRAVLEDLGRKLKRGAPVRLVATSLIEAGVDISFPEVWRAAAGLASIAQAAGRCNREGGPELGRVVVFEAADGKVPKEIEPMWQAAKSILARFEDPLALDAVRGYFQHLYWQKGPDAFDAATLEKKTFPILREIGARADKGKFPFDSIARAFRMIDDREQPVIVPWKAHPDDQAANTLLDRIENMKQPLAADLRRLKLYSVPVLPKARDVWLEAGVLRPVSRVLGHAVLRFCGLSFYDARTGLNGNDPTLIGTASLIA